MYKHLLGDYVKIQNTDGSIRGRQVQDTLRELTGTDSAEDGNQIVILADEATVPFDATGTFAMAYRDTNGVLSVSDNGGAGHAYMDNGMQTYLQTSVRVNGGSQINTADNTYTGFATLPVVSVILDPVYNIQGIVCCVNLRTTINSNGSLQICLHTIIHIGMTSSTIVTDG